MGTAGEILNFIFKKVPAKSFDMQADSVYPNNLRISNLYYFLLAPTLCYEMEYPRNISIRFRFALRRLLETIFLLWLIIALSQQWIIPHLGRAANFHNEC